MHCSFLLKPAECSLLLRVIWAQSVLVEGSLQLTTNLMQSSSSRGEAAYYDFWLSVKQKLHYFNLSLETPGSPLSRRSNTDRQLSLPTSGTISKLRDEDKRLPERQISSPSAFSTAKTQEKSEEEKERDEKQSETIDNLRKVSETPLTDLAAVSSSERLLPSGTPIQDLPAFPSGARRVIPSTSREEDKPAERTGAEGAPGTDNKGRKGRKETGNDKEK